MSNQDQKKCKHCQSDITSKMKRCPQCSGDLRNWARRHPILTGLLILIIIGLLPSIFGGSNSSSTSNQAVENSGNKSSKQYIEIFSFSGNGIKKSEPFHISGSRFKIAYDCGGDPSMTLCTAFVFKVGSQLPQGVMNSSQPIKDETVIYGSGEYYLDANTMGDFTMTVYDYK